MSVKSMAEPTETEISRALERINPRRIEPGDLRIAAVLMPLMQRDGQWWVLMTKRTDKVEHHKGEISFPGGHYEESDRDLEQTALRETEEEVGIDPATVKVLGRLDDIATITGFRIRPFVGVTPYPVELKPEPREIDRIIMLPLADFIHRARFERKLFARNGKDYPVYFFHFEQFTVWGATARILKQFLELALGFVEPMPGLGYREKEPPPVR